MRQYETKPCAICDAEFGPIADLKGYYNWPKWAGKRYCGNKCAREGRRRPYQTKPCVQCGSEFGPSLRSSGRNWDWGAWDRQKSCGPGCRYAKQSATRRAYEAKPCELCGEQFGPKLRVNGNYRWDTWRVQRFCGSRCRGKACVRPYETKPCAQCGQEYGPPGRGEGLHDWKFFDITRFCSQECAKDSVRRYPEGTRRSLVYQKHRLDFCERCLVGQSLVEKTFDVHHIDGDSFNNDTANFRTLCQGCHRDVHRKMAL